LISCKHSPSLTGLITTASINESFLLLLAMLKPRLQLSALFAPALREVPKDATLPSHRLLLRAGYMRQCAAGIYSLLPLAVRSLDKITSIINDEMVRWKGKRCYFWIQHEVGQRWQRFCSPGQAGIGAQRLAMPCMTPASLWKKSGRLDGAGEELIRFK
jgi:prolyl-tRNA synthetase